MPTSGAADSPTSLSKLKARISVLGQRAQKVWLVRLILLITGVVSIGYGQYLMETRLPVSAPNLAAELWNLAYRLEIPNYSNAYSALPYLIGGAFLCALTALPFVWKNPVPNWILREFTHERPRGQTLNIVIGIVSLVVFLLLLNQHLYAPIYLALWGISILAFTRVFWKLDKSSSGNLSLEISYTDLFWMTGLLLLGFVVVSFALRDMPIAIIPDEDSFWQTAHAIATNQMHPVIFDSGVFTFPIVSSIFQSWVLRIFGMDLWAWRFSSVIAGVLAIIPLYLLAKEWFGRHVAILACILMIVNPYFISFSRLGYNNIQSLFPVTLSVYLFALAARKDSYFYLCLAGLVSGFGFYTYTATLISPLILCFGILFLCLLKQLNWKTTLIYLSIILLGWGVVFLPRVVYLLSGNQEDSLVYRVLVASFANVFYGRAYYGEADLVNTMPLIHLGGGHTLFYDPVIYGELLYRGAVRTFLALFDSYVVSNHFLVAGLAGVITPVFFLIGLVVSLRARKQLRFGLALIWFFVGTILLSVFSEFPPAQTHLVVIIPVLALISTIGLRVVIDGSTELLLSRWTPLQAFIRNILMIIIALVTLYLGLQRYYITMPMTYPPSFENIPLWMARRIETPVNLLYVGQPEKAYRIGQLLNTTPIHHHYKSALINTFSPEADLSNTPTIFFMENQQTDEIPLLQKSPDGYHQPVKYYDADGETIGYAMTNTGIDLRAQISISEEFRSLIEKPVLYVLLLLIGMLILFGFLALREALGAPAYTRNHS